MESATWDEAVCISRHESISPLPVLRLSSWVLGNQFRRKKTLDSKSDLVHYEIGFLSHFALVQKLSKIHSWEFLEGRFKTWMLVFVICLTFKEETFLMKFVYWLLFVYRWSHMFLIRYMKNLSVADVFGLCRTTVILISWTAIKSCRPCVCVYRM